MPTANRALDIGTGLFVALGFAALAFLTTQLPGSALRLDAGSKGWFHVTARFDNVGDLKVGAPITMAGVRVGRVDSVGVDRKDFKAVVGLSIDRDYDEIPDDSFISIQTSGLLGAKYVGVQAGGAETHLKDGSQIPPEYTQSALVLENLINKLFSSFVGKKDDAQK